MQQVTRHNTKHTTHNTSSTIQSIHHQSTKAPNALHRTPQKQSFHKALTGTCCEAFSKLQWFDEAQYCNGKVNSIDWDFTWKNLLLSFFLVSIKISYSVLWVSWCDLAFMFRTWVLATFPWLEAPPEQVEKGSSKSLFQGYPHWLTCGFKADVFFPVKTLPRYIQSDCFGIAAFWCIPLCTWLDPQGLRNSKQPDSIPYVENMCQGSK